MRLGFSTPLECGVRPDGARVGVRDLRCWERYGHLDRRRVQCAGPYDCRLPSVAGCVGGRAARTCLLSGWQRWWPLTGEGLLRWTQPTRDPAR